MTRREIEYIAKLAASQANAGMSMPLAGEAPTTKAPPVAPSSTNPTPDTQSPGFIENLMQSIQGLLSGIDLSKSGPLLGMLSPLFQSVGSVAGIPGLAAMTDLFRGGSNIGTLGRGLFSRADTSDPDAAQVKAPTPDQVKSQIPTLPNTTSFGAAQKQTLQTPIPTLPNATAFGAGQQQTIQTPPPPATSPAKPVVQTQPKPVQPKPPKSLSTQSAPVAKTNTQPRRSNAPLA